MSFFVTGMLGLTLFSMLLFGAFYNLYRAQKMGKTLISSFFATMIVYSALEIPQYVLMAVQRGYTSKLGYCLHVLAVACFFVALSIICLSWMVLLFIAKQDRKDIIFKKRTLYAANGVLFVFVVLSVYFCVTAHSLESYFNSKFYLIYMIAEVFLFLFYNSAVVFFGMKISARFQNYIETGGEKTGAFRSALTKVITLMVINSICACTRVIMLILKIMHNVNSFDTSENSFVHHGLVWFALTDFVPFFLGGATFMLVMVTGSSKKRTEYDHEGALGADATQSLLGSNMRGGKQRGGGGGGEINHHKRSDCFQTPTYPSRQDNVVDSDIDNTPLTPEDEVTPPLQDDEENRLSFLGSRRRAYSYDANSSVTTNSPFYGQRNRHNEEFSPRTPTESQQRWMSFNSSSMLPSSLSPAGPGGMSNKHDLNHPHHHHNNNNNINNNFNNYNNNFNQHRPFKSMSNLRHHPEFGNSYTPPSQTTLSPIINKSNRQEHLSPLAARQGRVLSQKHAAATAAAASGASSTPTVLDIDESKVISTLSCQDFISESNSPYCNNNGKEKE